MNSKKIGDINETNANLVSQFKQLVPEESAPETLKKEVFDSLSTINLLADVLDLFTGKFAKTESRFLDLLSDNLEDAELKESNDTDEEMNPGSNQ